MGAAADRSGRLQARGLSGGGARTELLEPLDHNIEIRITGAKLASDPVPAAFGDAFSVRDHLELWDAQRWQQYLARLVVVAQGGQPAPDAGAS